MIVTGDGKDQQISYDGDDDDDDDDDDGDVIVITNNNNTIKHMRVQ